MEEKNLSPGDMALVGTDVTSWAQTIRRGYTLGFLLYAFHNTGVFESLKQGPKTAEQIASERGLDIKLLESGLNFFVWSDTSITKDDEGKYYMTEKGKERIFADQTVAMALGAIGAYNPLFTHYVAALYGKEKYGIDFERDGRLIAKASYLTGKKNYEWVVNKLADLSIETVVDLGCGSGDILIDFCQNSENLRGIGVDISKGALEEAKKRILEAGLNERISLLEGDMTQPSTYSHKIKEKGGKLAFNAIMSLHEFLRDGEEAVVDIFKKMKKEFPKSYFLLGEFNRISDQEFTQMPLAKKMHMLFYQEIIHGMTPQGLADKKTWLGIFERAGVEVLETKDDLPFRLVEYVLRL